MRNRKLGKLRAGTLSGLSGLPRTQKGCQVHRKAKALKMTARAAAKVPKSGVNLNKDYEA